MSSSNAMEEFGYLMGQTLAGNSFTYIFSLAGYIMLALGLYTIAKRRGIRNAWLAWIPFGQSWMLGCVSDQYQHVAQGKQKSKRKVLLWLEILTSVAGVITIISLVNALLTAAADINWAYAYVYDEEYLYDGMVNNMTDAQAMEMASSLMGPLGLAFVMLGLAIALAVVKYMALYDLFRSCNPDTATAFTVLSIFLGGVVMGIVVMVDRNKDQGMEPPRPAYGQPGYLPPQGWQQPPQGWQQPPQGWQQPPQGWQQPPQSWQQPTQQNWQQPQQPQDPWQNNNQQW